MTTTTERIDVLAAWDAMANSIANRRDECLERGQNVQAELYRDMISGHREARAAVAELIDAAKDARGDLGERTFAWDRLNEALARVGAP